MMLAVSRRLALVLALVGATACGDNLRPAVTDAVLAADAAAPDASPDAAAPALPPGGIALVPAEHLLVVAHPDDDLVFMQPDLFGLVSQHQPVTVVYVTAGDAGAGVAYSEDRYSALRFAYGNAAGVEDWSCGWILIDGHTAQHCRLPDANVSLVFLGYPDGQPTGSTPGSLLQLWEGTVTSAETIATYTTTYDQPGLIATVAELITTTSPAAIWTLEVSGTHSADHYDHMFVGALTVLGAAAASSTADLISYRGYNVNYEGPNLGEPIAARSSVMMRAYEACSVACTNGACGVSPCDTLDDPRYDGFVHRRYAVAMRRPPMTGQLHAPGGCATIADDNTVVVASCRAAPRFDFDLRGNVRVGNRCLAMTSAGALTVGACGEGGEQVFRFDDEGHLWAGVPPLPAPLMDYDHGLCVTADADLHVHGALCGATHDFTWQLERPLHTTRLDSVNLRSGGRAVRLGDLTGDGKADLCAIDPSGSRGLECAVGDGSGRFTAAIHIDSPAAPLQIAPASLALGDVDGDGRMDACGQNAGGIVCATAASGFAAAPWSTALTGAANVPVTNASVGIADGAVCELGAAGFGCATRGQATCTQHSTWPPATAALWSADLDGDGLVDWCSTTSAGPQCGLASEQAVSSDGQAWGFSLAGIVDDSLPQDGAVPDFSTSATADISGDGRADLCVAVGHRVECAISQGRGFGPRTIVLELPADRVVHSLWLGDLDGDGKADTCVDDGVTISCALSP